MVDSESPRTSATALREGGPRRKRRSDSDAVSLVEVLVVMGAGFVSALSGGKLCGDSLRKCSRMTSMKTSPKSRSFC